MKQAIHTVLFDLDGTLLDTAADLGRALNVVLEEQNREPLSLEAIRPTVSHGARRMIQFGFGYAIDDPRVDPLHKRLINVYAENIAVHTRLFPGMAEVLDSLDKKGIQWGIVTNKSSHLTTPLLEQVGLIHRSVCTISGDTLPQKKPDPTPLLHACELAGSEPQYCIYVGDALRDIEAGQRAGMRTVAALYGYIGSEENPAEWGATALLHEPLQLLTWIDNQSGENSG